MTSYMRWIDVQTQEAELTAIQNTLESISREVRRSNTPPLLYPRKKWTLWGVALITTLLLVGSFIANATASRDLASINEQGQVLTVALEQQGILTQATTQLGLEGITAFQRGDVAFADSVRVDMEQQYAGQSRDSRAAALALKAWADRQAASTDPDIQLWSLVAASLFSVALGGIAGFAITRWAQRVPA